MKIVYIPGPDLILQRMHTAAVVIFYGYPNRLHTSRAPGPDLVCSHNHVFQESRARAGKAGL